MKETILLTGFGPFGPHRRNVSGEAVLRLDGLEREGFVLRGLQLPVQLERAAALLEEALSEQPAAILCAGIHDDPLDGFRIELAAKNHCNYSIPDDDGQLVRDTPVDPQGQVEVFGTLPVSAIKLALEQAGLPVQLSEDAGSYLCNAVFYWVCSRHRPAGFLHVPPQEEGLEMVEKALDIAATATAKRLHAERVEATA